MSTEIESNLCTDCWGRGHIFPEHPTEACPRCKGTGEEPPFRWWPIIAMVVILVVGLFLIWGVH